MENLLDAIRNNNIEKVRLLLEVGVDIHAQEDEALMQACEDGNFEIARLLLEAGADVHAKEDEAITTAVFSGNLQLVKLLLEAGADVHASNDSSLVIASSVGRRNPDILRLLLKAGADIDQAILTANERDLKHCANFLQEYKDRQTRINQARENEEKNEQLRITALDEVKNREEKAPENPFIEAHCSSTENLYGDPLKDTDDIVVFELDGTKGDCYLKKELKLLRSDQYVRGVGEKAYKLPWSNVWITKSLKEFAERMEGHGPISLHRSEDIVGHNSNNILWVL